MPFKLKKRIASASALLGKGASIQPQVLFLCFLATNATKCLLAYVASGLSGTDLFLFFNYVESFLLVLLVYGGLAATGWSSLFLVFTWYRAFISSSISVIYTFLIYPFTSTSVTSSGGSF